MQTRTMRRRILYVSIVLALVAACSKSESPKAAPSPARDKPAARVEDRVRPEPLPVRAEGKLPEGFPYAIMEGDRIRQSTSFTIDGLLHFDVGLESDLEPESIADYWEKALEKRGVTVVRQRIEEQGIVRIVLQGDDADGLHNRVSVLHNTTESEDGEKAPAKISISVGRR